MFGEERGIQVTHGENFEDVDGLAQDVVNVWGSNATAGNGAYLSADFKSLFDKCCLYRDARKLADNRRQFNMMTEAEAAEEKSARQSFLEAHSTFSQMRSARA
jgi:hypothetical protein